MMTNPEALNAQTSECTEPEGQPELYPGANTILPPCDDDLDYVALENSAGA